MSKQTVQPDVNGDGRRQKEEEGKKEGRASAADEKGKKNSFRWGVGNKLLLLVWDSLSLEWNSREAGRTGSGVVGGILSK